MPCCRRAIPLFAVALGGCFPAITHGPRIEPGASAGLVASVTTGATHTEGDEGGIRLRQGVIGAYGNYGWAAARRKPGASIGVAVPIFFPLTQIDLFVEAPRGWLPREGAAGVGLVVDAMSFSAYGEVGQIGAGNNGWFLIGGYGRRQSNSRFESASPAWYGGGAVQIASSWTRTRLFVQFASGRDPGDCPVDGSSGCSLGRRASAVSTGVSLGWQQRARSAATRP